MGRKKQKKIQTLPTACEGRRQSGFADGRPLAKPVGPAAPEAATWPVYADGRGRRQSLPFCRWPDGTAIGKGHGVGRRLPWATFADGRTLPMAWPSAKIGIYRWLGFADGLTVGKDRLCLWSVFTDGWAVGKISLPMAHVVCRWLIPWSSANLVAVGK
jgi:hypothetical protein